MSPLHLKQLVLHQDLSPGDIGGKCHLPACPPRQAAPALPALLAPPANTTQGWSEPRATQAQVQRGSPKPRGHLCRELKTHPRHKVTTRERRPRLPLRDVP